MGVRDPRAMTTGRLLWSPSDDAIRAATITHYTEWLGAEHDLSFGSYDELWRWSVDDLGSFWRSIWRYFDVRATTEPTSALDDPSMPGARWFDGATLNHAEHLLRHRGDEIAVRAYREDGAERTLTRDELATQVGSVAAALAAMGVRPGDRVAAYLPNAPEAVIAFLATASLGAIWSSCSPDFGPAAVIDRFRQIEPTVLIAVDGYRYGGRDHDRSDAVASILAALPSVTSLVSVPALRDRIPAGATAWDDLLADPREPPFLPVPFDHPLWILYSSGTTGLPKPIVHGHGGIVLEHAKALGLHLDIRPDDRLFWYTTTGWMMWNFIVSGLGLGASIVLYDGSPSEPDLHALWRLAERAGITYLGTSAPFVHASMKRHVVPRAVGPLERLRAIGSTGAPLSDAGFDWIYDQLGPDVWLGSISGGTDLCTAFVGSCPTLPVYAGELQCRMLGAKVEAYDERGRAVTDEVGELVIERPMPSMPIRFWNDEGDRRYRESYFETFPGVWRHGDWIEVTSRGTCRISGRSDATLNRGGVRIGTAELYGVVEAMPEVREALVIDTGDPSRDGRLVLFVVLEPGGSLDDALKARIGDRLRSELSPRHAPDDIVEAPGVPTTLNGKRMEVPVKRLLLGAPVAAVANPDSVERSGAARVVRRADRVARLTRPGLCVVGELGRTDGARQVAEPGRHHRGGHAAEEVRPGGGGDPVDERLAEALREPAAHDDRLDVQQVLTRGERDPEGPHGPIEQPLRHGITVMQGLLDDAGRHAVPVVLGHQVEQHRVLTLRDETLSLPLHARPSRVGLEVPLPPAPASPTVGLDRHVPDLAGRAATSPDPAIEDEPAAHAGADRHEQEAREVPAGAPPQLADRGDGDVVVDVHGHRLELLRDRAGEVVLRMHALDVGAARHHTVHDDAGRADADRCQLVPLDTRVGCGRPHRVGDRRGDAVGGSFWGRALRRAEELPVALHDRQDLRAAEVDAGHGPSRNRSTRGHGRRLPGREAGRAGPTARGRRWSRASRASPSPSSCTTGPNEGWMAVTVAWRNADIVREGT